MKYRDLSTYKYKRVVWYGWDVTDMLSTYFNRSTSQVVWLFNLVDGDLDKYFQLEWWMWDHHVPYCPNSEKEVEVMLKHNDVYHPFMAWLEEKLEEDF